MAWHSVTREEVPHVHLYCDRFGVYLPRFLYDVGPEHCRGTGPSGICLLVDIGREHVDSLNRVSPAKVIVQLKPRAAPRLLQRTKLPGHCSPFQIRAPSAATKNSFTPTLLGIEEVVPALYRFLSSGRAHSRWNELVPSRLISTSTRSLPGRITFLQWEQRLSWPVARSRSSTTRARM